MVDSHATNKRTFIHDIFCAYKYSKSKDADYHK